MLFSDITYIDKDFRVIEHAYIGTKGERIAYIGDKAPDGDFGETYDGRNRLLIPAFVNGHAHSPMTLMRGYGENMALSAWLNERIFPFEAKLTGDAVYWGTMLAMAESVRFGIVSTSDMYYFCDDMARAVIESGAKANISRSITCFTDEAFDDLESVSEMKAFLRDYHKAADGRVLVDMSLHAEYTSNERIARALADFTRAAGVNMHVHVSETRDEVAGCRERHEGRTPVRYLADCGIFDTNTTAAHCVHLADDDLDILKEKRVTVATNPVSNLKLASGVCDTPALLRAGINMSIGTDSVSSNNSLNFIEEMKAFACAPKGFFGDPAAITPAETLAAATRGGAIAQGRGDSGYIEEGMRADIAALKTDVPHMHPAHDILTNLVYSASGSDVALTMADGRVLYRDGEYKTIDIERTIFETERATADILSRL